MLDYEVLNYKITYKLKTGGGSFDHYVGTEEMAVEYIKKHRSQWAEYRLLKMSVAII